MNDTFTLLCQFGTPNTANEPEFVQVHDFKSCADAVTNAEAWLRRHGHDEHAEAEVWLNRQHLIWDSREPWRGSWNGPAAVGLYAVHFDNDGNPSYHLKTSRSAA